MLSCWLQFGLYVVAFHLLAVSADQLLFVVSIADPHLLESFSQACGLIHLFLQFHNELLARFPSQEVQRHFHRSLRHRTVLVIEGSYCASSLSFGRPNRFRVLDMRNRIFVSEEMFCRRVKLEPSPVRVEPRLSSHVQFE